MRSAATIAVVGCLLLKLAVFIDYSKPQEIENLTDESHPWSYVGSHDASHWFEDNAKCRSSEMSEQSPINIQESEAVSTKFPELQLIGYNSTKGVTIRAVNLGHTVEFEFLRGNYKLSGGGLRGIFKLKQLHLHWGATSSNGSEHQINKHVFPLEMHMVHYNTIYHTIEEAAAKENGLAVLAFLSEVASEENVQLKPLTDTLQWIVNYNDEIRLATPVAPSSFLPRDLQSFFRYHGSLTTPPCYETVTWTIFKEPIKISEPQLELFRGLLSSDREVEGDSSTPHLPLVNNFRPPQPLGGRLVFKNGLHYEKKQTSRACIRRASIFIVGLAWSLLVVLKGSIFYQTKH